MTFYKVVRPDLTSLQLLIKGKSFEPVQYVLNEWAYPKSTLGGLFVSRNKRGVVWLSRYISQKKVGITERSLDFSDQSRVFECEIGNIIGKFDSKFMAEVDKVRLIKEVEVKVW